MITFTPTYRHIQLQIEENKKQTNNNKQTETKKKTTQTVRKHAPSLSLSPKKIIMRRGDPLGASCAEGATV